MANRLRILKLNAFIFLYLISLFCAGDCWPRYKRSYNDMDPTMTASLYEKLKKSLAPVLEKTIDLSTAPLEYADDKTIQKRFNENAKKEAEFGLKSDSRNTQIALEQNRGKRSSPISQVFPASRKYDINTILVPHRGNQSALAVADHENDYDYGDRDLPDIEEPPAHIFEHANGTNKKIEKIALNPNLLLSYPFFPGEFGNSYEKCKQHLEPLIQKNLKAEKLSKLEEKLLEPYVKLIPQANDQDRNTAMMETKLPGFIVATKNLEYSSLYDQFKKRLQDFSSELGLDVGLSKDNETTDSKAHQNTSRNSFKTLQDLSFAFKKAQALVDHIEDQSPLSLKKRQNGPSHDAAEHSQQKRANFEATTQSSNTVNNFSPPKNNFGADFDFWLQQRGYQYKNHKDEPPRKLDLDNDYNVEKYDSNINGYADDGFDYNDVIKPMNVFKNSQKPIKDKTRLFRGIDDIGNNFLPDKSHGTDGSSLNKFFPNVLIEPVPTPFGTTSKLSARSLLEDVAHKLNMSTLDVAKKIAAIQDLNLTTLKADPELHNTLQQYIENSVLGSAFQAQVGLHLPKVQEQNQNFASEVQHNQNAADMGVETSTKSPFLDCVIMPNALNNGCPWEQTKVQQKPDPVEIPAKKCGSTGGNKAGLSEEQVSKILEKLLAKLQEIQFEKSESEPQATTTSAPLEDTSCKLSGSWFSAAMGLRFDICLNNATELGSEPEAQRINLGVEVKECMPPRPHDIIDTKWPFVGSAIKEMGGPFYLYTQKKSDNILATFVGYCRTCGNMDTIFGTWSFSLPAKCCQDTPASFQTKNDVMHRYSLEEKRRERYKDLLYKQSKYSLKKV